MKGQVFELRPARTAGHEQSGRRYAVVTLASRFEHLSTWLVVPTSTRATPCVFRPEITVPGVGPTLAMCDMLTAVDPEKRLGDEVGFVTLDEMRAVDLCVMRLMDLPEEPL